MPSSCSGHSFLKLGSRMRLALQLRLVCLLGYQIVIPIELAHKYCIHGHIDEGIGYPTRPAGLCSCIAELPATRSFSIHHTARTSDISNDSLTCKLHICSYAGLFLNSSVKELHHGPSVLTEQGTNMENANVYRCVVYSSNWLRTKCQTKFFMFVWRCAIIKDSASEVDQEALCIAQCPSASLTRVIGQLKADRHCCACTSANGELHWLYLPSSCVLFCC